MDKEYIILDEIDKNKNITQRELSVKAGLSLGSINLLLNKMAKDGQIKIKQIPMNRVIYMLTPKGLAEKIDKTYHYIKYHYNYIDQTKLKIEDILKTILKTNEKIYIINSHDELGDLVKAVAKEFKGVEFIESVNSCDQDLPVIILNNDLEQDPNLKSRNLINLLMLL